MQEEEDLVHNPHLKIMRRWVSYLTHAVGGVQGLPNLQGLAGAQGAQPTPQDHNKVSKLHDPWGGRDAGFA